MKKIHATTGQPGASHCTAAPAKPAPPQTAASVARNFHSGSASAATASRPGHSNSRHGRIASAVTQLSRAKTSAPPTCRKVNPAGATGGACCSNRASTAAMVAASFSLNTPRSTSPNVATASRCDSGSIRTALTSGSVRKKCTSSATQLPSS